MVQQQKKLPRQKFEKLLKELQIEQSWLKFYTELSGTNQPEKAKICNRKIKELKKELGFE